MSHRLLVGSALEQTKKIERQLSVIRIEFIFSCHLKQAFSDAVDDQNSIALQIRFLKTSSAENHFDYGGTLSLFAECSF